MSEAQAEQDISQSPGELLKQGRLAANLSTEQIASRLNIKPAIVFDLEENKFDSFASPTFMRGYLRGYAKIVNVDEEQLFKLVERFGGKKAEAAEMQSFSKRTYSQNGDNKIMLVGYGVLALAVLGIIGWWLKQGEGLETNRSRVSQVAGVTLNSQDSARASATNPTDRSRESSSNVPAMNSTSDAANDSSTISPNEQADSAETSINPNENSNDLSAQTNQSEDIVDNLPDEQSANDAMIEESTQSDDNLTTVDNGTVESLSESTDAVNDDFQDAESSVEEISQPAEDFANDIADSSTGIQTDAENLLNESVTNDDDLLNDGEALLAEAESVESDLSGDVSASAFSDETVDTSDSSATEQYASLSGPVPLELRFAESCWVKVTDNTGESLIVGTKQPGHVSQVEGVPPFKFLLGNPQAVTILIDGEEAEKPDTPRGAIAKFELPASEE